MEYYGSWAHSPAPIEDASIKETINADIVICGAGIAGVTCALRAAQCGASVVVLEKTNSWSARGGNIGVPNSSFMRSLGYENDLQEIAREWIKRCGNRCDERVLWKYLNHGERAMDWLIDIVTAPEYGARTILQGCLYLGDTYKEIVGSHRFFDGPMAKKGARAGAADAVNAMYKEALKLGVVFHFNAPAIQLLKESDRVTGVYAQRDDEIILVKATKGVVLSTGDIGGNDEMCEELAPLANKVTSKIYSPRGANTGDGHCMGYWAGGSFESDDFPCVLHTQSFFFSNYCFLFVGPDGRRFMNEDNYVQGKSIAVIREGFKYVWAIIDSEWQQKVPMTLPYGGGLFWGHDCELGEMGFDVVDEQGKLERGLKSGLVVKADTIEGLAEAMDVPIKAFQNTFNRYGEITKTGDDIDFGKRKELLIPLDKPPYYGLKFGPALLAVCGGLRVDEEMRVLSENREPVSGLYAIGNTAGGRYGVDYPMMIPGNSHGTAMTFGYYLGEQLGLI